MSGAIPPLPNTPSWRGAQLKHRDNFTLLWFTHYLLHCCDSSLGFLMIVIVWTLVTMNIWRSKIANDPSHTEVKGTLWMHCLTQAAAETPMKSFLFCHFNMAYKLGSYTARQCTRVHYIVPHFVTRNGESEYTKRHASSHYLLHIFRLRRRNALPVWCAQFVCSCIIRHPTLWQKGQSFRFIKY
jgi:hypothetical protein